MCKERYCMLQNCAVRCWFLLARGRCFAFVLYAKRVLIAGLSTWANKKWWGDGTACWICLPSLVELVCRTMISSICAKVSSVEHLLSYFCSWTANKTVNSWCLLLWPRWPFIGSKLLQYIGIYNNFTCPWLWEILIFYKTYHFVLNQQLKNSAVNSSL